MRTIAIIVLILGVASLVFGIYFVVYGSDGKQEVADNIAPLPLDKLDATYDEAKAGIQQMEAAGIEPELSLKLKKTGLGLSRANVGTARFAFYSGIVDIIIGAGLILAGVGLLKKSSSAA
jgi:hypothetical protein